MSHAYCVRCKAWVDASRIDPLEIACREHHGAFVPEWQRVKSVTNRKRVQRWIGKGRKTA